MYEFPIMCCKIYLSFPGESSSYSLLSKFSFHFIIITKLNLHLLWIKIFIATSLPIGFKLGSEEHTTEVVVKKCGALQVASGIGKLKLLKTTQVSHSWNQSICCCMSILSVFCHLLISNIFGFDKHHYLKHLEIGRKHFLTDFFFWLCLKFFLYSPFASQIALHVQ